MSSIAHEGRGHAARPPLPTWSASFTAAVLGWAIAMCAIGTLATTAMLLGVLDRPAGAGLRDWPYPDSGWTSIGANTVVWLWILAATALLVRGMLADRYHAHPVSAVMVFVVLLVTGFAPLVPRGLLDLPGPVALVFTAALLRLAPAFGPAPLTKRATAKLAAVASALLVIPALHGFLHPLWPREPIAYEPPQRNAITLSLKNAGFAGVDLEALSLDAPGIELAGVRVDDHPPFSAEPSPGLPSKLEPRSEAFIELRLRHLGCGAGSLPAKAMLRYEVYGLQRAETVPVRVALRPC